MEYPDAINPRTIAAAVRITRQLRVVRTDALETLAAEAVMQTFCSCVTTAEDAAEHRFSAIHKQIIADVVTRVRISDVQSTGTAS